MNNQTKQLILSMIPKWIAVAIILVLVVYNFAGGQQSPVPVDYLLNSEYELKPNPPEIVPYQIVPLDPIPDCRLEMGIEIVYPQSIVNLPEPQKEEVLQISCKRIAYEISNPEDAMGLFAVDGQMYHLLRIPYTAGSHFWGWEYE